MTESADESTGTREDQPSKREGLFPVTPKWFTVTFYAVLLVWDGLLIFWAQDWRYDDRFFPTLVGVLVAIIAVAQLLKTLFPDLSERLGSSDDAVADQEVAMNENKERIENATKADTGRTKSERETYELLMIAWVTALPLLMYFVGFTITLPLYVFSFTWYFLRDLKTAAIVTAAFSLFIYVLFVLLLDVQLWEGVLGIPDPIALLS